MESSPAHWAVGHPSMAADVEAAFLPIECADIVLRAAPMAEEEYQVFAVADRKNVVARAVFTRLGVVAVFQEGSLELPGRQNT